MERSITLWHTVNMEMGVVANVCSFVVFMYIIAVIFKLLQEGPHQNLATKLGLVYTLIMHPLLSVFP